MDSWPEVRYASVGDADVAYTVLGDAPVDLVFFFGLGSHVDLAADDPLQCGCSGGWRASAG